jgi:hypothetical protein
MILCLGGDAGLPDYFLLDRLRHVVCERACVYARMEPYIHNLALSTGLANASKHSNTHYCTLFLHTFSLIFSL